MIASQTHRRAVEGYCNAVLSGDVVAGELVQAAVRRHQEDLVRARDVDWPYEFDYGEAERRCNFFPGVLKFTKGEWSGRTFQLEPWQQFNVSVIVGWKCKVDGSRRFRKAYICVGRKNGKTQLVSGFALGTQTIDNEPEGELYCAATKREQAMVLFREAERMVARSPLLRQLCELHRQNISWPATDSFFRPMSSDKAFDGADPTVVVFDEYHEYREVHRKFVDSMTTGSGARRNPLEIITTTAGGPRSRLWKEEDSYAVDVVEGRITDDSLFVFIARIDPDDDPFDESVWQKANPNLGVSCKLRYLRDAATEAEGKPTARNRFIRHHMNRQVRDTEQLIDPKVWASAGGELSDWSQADYVGGGFDLGGMYDLAGAALCARFKIEDPEPKESEEPKAEQDLDEEEREEKTKAKQRARYRYEFRTRAYMDSETERDLDKQPFAEWIHNEQLIVSEEVFAQLRDDLFADFSDYRGDSVAYDPHNAKQLGVEFAQAGIDIATMPQIPSQFHEPIKEFQRSLTGGRIRHDGCPVLAWCANNLTVKRNSKDEWMCDKAHSRDKIDVMVALLMAYREALFGVAKRRWKASHGIFM